MLITNNWESKNNIKRDIFFVDQKYFIQYICWILWNIWILILFSRLNIASGHSITSLVVQRHYYHLLSDGAGNVGSSF